MSLNYRIPRSRGANVIDANPQRLESKDGTRWACGRNVKVSVGPRRYEAVEVWTLRMRDKNGKAVTIARHVSRMHATDWVGPFGLETLKRWVKWGI